MSNCLFVTDLHGSTERYEKLFRAIRDDRPEAVFLGGDLLSYVSFRRGSVGHSSFATEYLVPALRKTRSVMAARYPEIFLILGNDDSRCEENDFLAAEKEGLCHYMHARKFCWQGFAVYGLAYVPPTPFLLKDWERYDISRHIPPGCVSPEEGLRTVTVEAHEIKWTTIQEELNRLVRNDSLEHGVFLFHSPPHDTPLDRAALDGKLYDEVPLDVHLGSIAIRQFIEERQPLLTLHGHVHEAARLTGKWKHQSGRTVCLNAAHDGPELALVRFDPDCPGNATRELV